MSIIHRLKERRFIQILASYLAAGWVAIEVIAQLVERGRLPDMVYGLALMWYVAGLLIALLVGWYHGEKGRQRAPMIELAAITIIALATLGLSSVNVATYVASRAARTAAEASSLDLHRVAVLYFEDLSARAELAAAADGFTESMITELSTVRGLDVLSRGAVEPYRGTGATPERVGRALEAGTLVTGTVERLGERVRLSVRLLHGESGIEVQRTSFDLEASELLSARDTLAALAARMLREWLGEEVRLRSTKRGTTTVAAWLLYQRGEKERKEGEAAGTRGEPEQRVVHFMRADSLLAEAQRADESWADPYVLRGHLAYRLARVATGPAEVERWVELGLARVAPALTRDPSEARALEVRGTLKYWLALQQLDPDPKRTDALTGSARADLERAVAIDPTLAGAHAILSHLYMNVPDLPAAVLSARRAYEEDAYLENAEAVVWRLVASSYNLEQFVEMGRWCALGERRFPDNYRFACCQIQLMTTPAVAPDASRAWALLARVDSLAPPHQLQFEHVRAELSIGGILARAGMVDSARAVLRRAHDAITPEIDPQRDLYRMEAYILTFLGDYDAALELIKLDAALHPDVQYGEHWWWRELRNHPRWREAAGT